MKDVKATIDALENEFYDSKGFLWSKKSLIDVDRCVLLLEDLKANIPDGVNDINYLRAEKQRLISSAEERAANIIGEAEARAEKLVSESALVQSATFEADRVKNKAMNEISKYENSAMMRLSTMLADIENFLSEALSLVRNSREDVELNMKQARGQMPSARIRYSDGDGIGRDKE